MDQNISQAAVVIETAQNRIDQGFYDSASVLATIAIAKALVSIATSLQSIAERGIFTHIQKDGEF